MQTFQKMTAKESTTVRARERCEAKMFRGQEMTYNYISMKELTLRTAHVLAGRINYPTGRIYWEAWWPHG